jgi:hypothetical protein
MSTQALLRECAAKPLDDVPRLVWADAVGGERGELVAIQCAARDVLPVRELAALNRRERELLVHRMEWSGLAGIAHRVQFHRGFVDAIDVDAATFAARGDEIAARAPLLEALTLRGFETVDELYAAIDQPAFAKIRALDVYPNRGSRARTTDALVRAGVLEQLVALGLTVEPLDSDVLARAPLARLELRGEINAAVLALPHAPQLASLTLPHAQAGIDRSLVELRTYDDSAIAAARHLGTRVERLGATMAHRVPEGLGELSRLVELSLAQRSAPPWPELARDVPASVRVLRLAHRDADTVQACATRLAAQLDVLDLRGSPAIDDFAHACDLLLDEPAAYELMSAQPRRRGEWLVRGDLSEPPGGAAWLVAEDGPVRGQIWDLAEHRSLRIGRSLAAGIAWIGDGTVARAHADIEWRAEAHWIADLRTTNGTTLDGEPVEHYVRLYDGAKIGVASHVMRFFCGLGGGMRARRHARALTR